VGDKGSNKPLTTVRAGFNSDLSKKDRSTSKPAPTNH
jgi:hypothetical protein